MKILFSVIITFFLSVSTVFALEVDIKSKVREMGNDKINWCKIFLKDKQDPIKIIATIRNGDFIILMVPPNLPYSLTQAHFDEEEMKSNGNPLTLAGRFLIFSGGSNPYEQKIIHVQADSNLTVLEGEEAKRIEKMFR